MVLCSMCKEELVETSDGKALHLDWGVCPVTQTRAGFRYSPMGHQLDEELDDLKEIEDGLANLEG